MYRRLYRQEGGGLGGLNPHDYMRQYVDKYVQDYNQSNQGEVAAKVMPRPVPQVGIGQRIKTGISNLVPDTVKNYAAIPINLFNSLGGGNTGYMSPEMIEATRQAALNAIERTGQDTNVSMDSSDYYGTKGFGFGEGELDAGTLGGYPKIFTDAGSGAGSAAVTYGGATVNKNPGTGEISFTPGSGDYDMSDNNPIWLGGIPGNLGLSDKNPMNVPMESFIDPAFTAAKEYGDIEAQAEANRLNQEQEITNNPYIGASTNSPMWFGGYPLQSGDTLTTEQIRMDRQGGSKDYRIPPNLTTQYNEDGTGTIISKPTDEINNTPGYNTDNWFKALEYYNPNYREQRANAFQPVATPISMQNEQPINTGGFGVDFTNSNRDLINTTDFNLLQNYYQGQQ